MIPEEGAPNPPSRMDMVFLLTDDVIFMHGGYADNYLYDDVWYFDLTTHKWLEKKRFVYPRYPDSCTDDWEYILQNDCTSLEWPLHLQRDINYPYDILPPVEQPFRFPDSDIGPYFNIFDKGMIPEFGNFSWLQTPVPNTPMVPYAASGPLQYVKAYEWIYNYTTNITLYERCTSVVAESTRGKVRVLSHLLSPIRSFVFLRSWMDCMEDLTRVSLFLCREDSVLIGMAAEIETMGIFCSVKNCNTSNRMPALVRHSPSTFNLHAQIMLASLFLALERS